MLHFAEGALWYNSLNRVFLCRSLIGRVPCRCPPRSNLVRRPSTSSVASAALQKIVWVPTVLARSKLTRSFHRLTSPAIYGSSRPPTAPRSPIRWTRPTSTPWRRRVALELGATVGTAPELWTCSAPLRGNTQSTPSTSSPSADFLMITAALSATLSPWRLLRYHHI